MYSILYTFFFIFFLPVYVFLLKKKGYKFGFKERFVLYTPKNLKEPVWFHCASVGELNTAKPLIIHYSKSHDILITISSPRGKEYAEKIFPEFEVRFLPLDYKFLFKRFLKMYNPKICIVVEGEFWFNFVITTSFLPIISVNTRISPSSYRFYKKLSFFYKKIFNAITKFLVRSESDKKFLEEFVENKEKIVVCGDLKFISSGLKKEVRLDKNNKRVLIAGSTHESEEKFLLEVYKKLKNDFPDLVLIIAPRHLERIKEVVDLIEKYGFSYSFRSKIDKLETDVYILDTLGELSGIYKYADLVFVGGTIAKVGGHNILEPALENKPVIIGENYFKIKDLYETLKPYNVAFVVHNEEDFYTLAKRILSGDLYIKIDLKNIQEQIRKCYISNINKILYGEENDR